MNALSKKWEQGRAKRNPQAAALVLLVRNFPDTLERLDPRRRRNVSPYNPVDGRISSRSRVVNHIAPWSHRIRS